MPGERGDDVLGEQLAPVSIQKARSTPLVSSWGKRRGSSASLSSVIGLPSSASTAAERAAQVSPLPARASVPVGA